MHSYTLATQTMFAELVQSALDAEFDESFRERGNFKRRMIGGKFYWYYSWDADGKKHERYVGPFSDQAITDRVNRFAGIKSDFKQRREMVRALTAARLPRPDAISGSVVEAMWKAGFFRLRGVLIGSLAYQCYAGLLGVRLSAATLMTADADFAQFWGVSENIGETMRHPLEVLREVDATFREMPSIDDPFVTTRYRSKLGYKVEFLTPNRGSDKHQQRPVRMKSMAGAGAQPLRHLDFLLHQSERSVLLFGGGVPVTVPRAERYAVHKLIVAVERSDGAKSRKDIEQATTLIMALAGQRPRELGEAYLEARKQGKSWREKLAAGVERLPDMQKGVLRHAAEIVANSRNTP
jgi:hypothetical protein